MTLFVVFGTYKDISHPIAYVEDEHTASRLVDLLAASDLTWEHVGYSEITTYRQNNDSWDYPFVVKYVETHGYIIKPPWIDFNKITVSSLVRSNTHETSRKGEGGILPSSTEDEPIHNLDDFETVRENFREDVRSRMRGRSRINRSSESD